jgi:hypothetical protein
VTPLPVRVLLALCLMTMSAPSALAEPPKPSTIRIESLRAPRILQSRTTAAIAPEPPSDATDTSSKSLTVGALFADAGFSNGFRFSNLGGRREVYIPVPQGIELELAELVLVFDDMSAYDARRSLEILANDRSISAIALDGKSTGRTVRISLRSATARNGFLKLSFLYSGAATQDRCIDVRYIGDSLTVRPESAVEFRIGLTGTPNIAATAALMPQDVAILLSDAQLSPSDIATALTLGRSLKATGRHVTFHHGVEELPELARQRDPHAWTRGLIVVGPLTRLAGLVDAQITKVASAAGSVPIDNTLAAARVGGVPVLLVADAASARVGRLIGNPSLAALRDVPSASVGQVTTSKGSADRVSFDELGVVPAQADVFGRADLSVAIASRMLTNGTRPSRLILDVMVAPDGDGEKAVVSVFVNERLLGSTVAAIGEPTRLDLALPNGLVGAAANIRAVVQRRSAQGDCRFEPQGYPAEILGSSAVVLSPESSAANDFFDLATLWSGGVEVLVPLSAAARPLAIVGLLADVLSALSNESAPIIVSFVDTGAAPKPGRPFIAVNTVAPAGATQRVRFDRGRVAVADRAGRTRLDIGGLASGAVAQIVTSGSYSGLWIRPLSHDGSLPVSPAVNLDRGDVAFLDNTGVALALSTERDTLLRISYPDQASLVTSIERFRSWIIGGIWGVVSIVLLFALQRIYRRRGNAVAGK